MRLMMVIAAALALAGCVTARPGAERIVLSSNADLLKGCAFLGQEHVSSSSLPLDYVTSSVLAQIKERAMDLGGTHVLTTGPSISSPGPVASLNGDIYRCGA